MSVCGPQRRKSMAAPMSAVGVLSGLVLLTLSSSDCDPERTRPILGQSDCSCSAYSWKLVVPSVASIPHGASVVTSAISRPASSWHLATISHAIRAGRGNWLSDRRLATVRTGSFSTTAHTLPNLSVNRHSTIAGKSSLTHPIISARIYVVTTYPPVGDITR
jgi:hypothetical protein